MSFSVMSSSVPMRDGSDFRNQMWATGRGELDVAHALAAHARQRDLDAALLADDALVLHALVLAAQALVVLDRPEDARAEQAVALGLERAVVDGLRLLDLAERPGQDLLGAGERDPHRIEHLRRGLRIEEIHDLLVHAVLLLGPEVPSKVSGVSPVVAPIRWRRMRGQSERPAAQPPELRRRGSRAAPRPRRCPIRPRRAAGAASRRPWCSPARR